MSDAPSLPYAAPAAAPRASDSSLPPLADARVHALAHVPSARMDRACYGVLCAEMARAVAASTAYRVRCANHMVAQLRLDDPDAHVPPDLSLADQDEMASSRMDAIGRAVGAGLTERLCIDRARFHDALDAAKFLCKELWSAVYDKPIDNLRTNHRGVFVLQDTAFSPLVPLDARDAPPRAYVQEHIAYAVGLLQGALERLGHVASVQTDASVVPQCSFHVRVG
ncbi:hypothetical protein MSPP1_001748 [Malassezia sp. CBS 17886]|nr:hypothetical protein MSPP1_001748 [Malassezia sp. CBS 17886]